MAAWTLTEAREHLSYWLELDKQLTQTGQYTVFSTRTRQDVNAAQVLVNIRFWRDEVHALENQASGEMRFWQVSPR